MQENQLTRIQFIGSSYPGYTTWAEVERRAHSHAARTAHAKARRLRIISYQASKRKKIPKVSQQNKEQEDTLRHSVLLASDAIGVEKSTLASPESLLASDRRDPFQSFARAFKPIEYFLLDHYVRGVLPYMNITCNKLKDPKTYLDLMTKEWVRLTLTNVGSLNGIFLAACRHLLQFQQQHQHEYYLQLATHYKLLCLQALREAIFSEKSSMISDSTVTVGILLAYDELQLGDISSFKCHSRGLIQMVEHNGGPQTMGANGFLERLVCKFIGNLEPACKYILEPW